MNDKRYKDLLTPLFVDYDKEMVPANNELIACFYKEATAKGIPNEVIEQLIEFYKVTNGIPCLNGFSFHCCDDEILFEWWDDKELWLGESDDDILRWVSGKYCLGDASEVSYSDQFEYLTLYELIETVCQIKEEE